jgi:hypothetical protein
MAFSLWWVAFLPLSVMLFNVSLQNFAGAPASPSARAILATLDKTFGACRAFHDYTQEITDEKLKQEFSNLVFFCRVTGSPVSFRAPVAADSLNSHLRQFMFRTFEQREVPRAWIEAAAYTGQVPPEVKDEDKWVMTDNHNPLMDWQKEGAMQHWKGADLDGYLSMFVLIDCIVSDARGVTLAILEDILSKNCVVLFCLR